MNAHGMSHPICDKCYAKAEPDRMPHRLHPGYWEGDSTCCWCGKKFHGIYYPGVGASLTSCPEADEGPKVRPAKEVRA